MDPAPPRLCALCGSAGPGLMTCAGCLRAQYCDVACQRAHRKVHRKECQEAAGCRDGGHTREHGKAAEEEEEASEVAEIGGGVRAMRISSAATRSSPFPAPSAVSVPEARVDHSYHVLGEDGTFTQVKGDQEVIGSLAKGRAHGSDEEAVDGKEIRGIKARSNKFEEEEEEEGEEDALPPKREDCQVCCVTLPLIKMEIFHMDCCGKLICRGCIFESRKALAKVNARRLVTEKQPPLKESCPFCREVFFSTEEEYLQRLEKRIEKGDALAMNILARKYRTGQIGLQPNTQKMFELNHRAAELGLSDACFDLSVCYREGCGVTPDPAKERHYLERAAKLGSVKARCNLGSQEEDRGNFGLAFRHYKMAAAAGCKTSLDAVQGGFIAGFVSKDEFADCLRANQRAHDDQWSDEREKHKQTDVQRTPI